MYSAIRAFSIFFFIMFVVDDSPRLVNKVSGVCQVVEVASAERQLIGSTSFFEVNGNERRTLTGS